MEIVQVDRRAVMGDLVVITRHVQTLKVELGANAKKDLQEFKESVSVRVFKYIRVFQNGTFLSDRLMNEYVAL